MYLADYHMHSRWSNDAHIPMADMVLTAIDAGLDEICFTDHVEVKSSGSDMRNYFDWPALSAEYAAAQKVADGRILLRRGVELGEATRDISWCEELRRQMPPMDFIIGSRHQLSAKYGNEDLYFASSGDPALALDQIRDYLQQVLLLAKWGNFSVLGHLTLPLRYMNENHGLHMTFDGFEAEVEEIFRTLIANGCGIEVNTNRGHDPLPGEKWLRLYRGCGGEIVTLGSDAHTREFVGCNIAQQQELLRACGFRAFATFEKMQPVFHDL
ncbi:MAG: histidinol-phosphatase HisJ family protein [Oscillibacter sp.]|jgi:histidinol-phosphatase (PHP family)|nr:histidinol-phosphatase HisJ family protein [Oscillibacter sp.]